MDLKTHLFINQTLDTLQLKKDKRADYLLSWKSKRVFNSKLKPIYTVFLHNFLNIELEQKLIKILNFISKQLLNQNCKCLHCHLKFKNCLFEATNKVKNSDKEKYVYGEYRIAFKSEIS